jgi:hypothetical protein
MEKVEQKQVTVKRVIAMPEEMYKHAKAVAGAEDTNVTDLIRIALAAYLDAYPREKIRNHIKEIQRFA